MKIEGVVLGLSVLTALLSALFIPRNKRLQAQFLFMFVSMPAWVLGLCAVEWGWIEYPYRELSSVNRTSFIFEYLVLPMICVHFNTYYPGKASLWNRICYYAAISGIVTAFEYVLERYTMLLKYIGWELWWTFVSVCMILWLSRVAVQWFFHKA